MDLGYDGTLYILAFDHRGSFKKKMFGLTDEPTPEEVARLEDAKRVVFAGVERALADGLPRDAVGVLVDEEMGAGIAWDAKAMGLKLAMPVEASGQPLFDFEYGEDFGSHLEQFDPEFAKVLVRWNPADSDADKAEQGSRLKRLGDWLHARDRKYLFELLVPASAGQLELLGGDTDAYDTEARPFLTFQAIDEIQSFGIEPDIWKIEGLDRRIDSEILAKLIRRDGRDGVAAVVLGRGADDARVDHWLAMGAPVDGYCGFAIGRSIWWDGVAGWKDGTLDQDQAAASIAASFRRFIDVYEAAR